MVTPVLAGVEPLKDGHLFRISGQVEMDERVSWVPEGISGVQPNNCYLLRAPDASVLIDSGAAVHREIVMSALSELLEPDATISCIFTRMESDCIGNLGDIARRYDVPLAFAQGNTNPFDFFDDVGSESALAPLSTMTVVRKAAQEPLAWSSTAPPLQLISTPLRVLATSWVWDPHSGTMFTSDTFDFLHTSDQPGQHSRDELVRRFLTTRHDWIVGATTHGLREDVARLFDSHDVRVIAPSRGYPIVGEFAVAEAVACVLRTLDDVGVAP